MIQGCLPCRACVPVSCVLCAVLCLCRWNRSDVHTLCHVSCVLQCCTCVDGWMESIGCTHVHCTHTYVYSVHVATRTCTTKELQEFLLPIDPGNHPPHQPGSSSHIHSPTHAHKGFFFVTRHTHIPGVSEQS